MREMCEQSLSNAASHPVDLLLVMSKLCRDFELSTVEYILTLTDEQFHINPRNKKTSVSFFNCIMFYGLIDLLNSQPYSS